MPMYPKAPTIDYCAECGKPFERKYVDICAKCRRRKADKLKYAKRVNKRAERIGYCKRCYKDQVMETFGSYGFGMKHKCTKCGLVQSL